LERAYFCGEGTIQKELEITGAPCQSMDALYIEKAAKI
jgi:hypothetical protein